MTKKQFIKTIRTVIESPRNNEQKISMLEQSFEQYVHDTTEQTVKRLESNARFYNSASDDDQNMRRGIVESIEVVKEELKNE